MELKTIDSYNTSNAQVKWNDQFPKGTLEKYKKLVANLEADICINASSYMGETPVDLADLNFSNNASCLISNIIKEHNYPLLHDTIEHEEHPLKKEDRTKVLVMSGSLPGTNDLFVIKSQPYDELMTEYLVGKKLNELRADIPNFALVYGLFNCSSPVADAFRVGSWCVSQNNGTGYMVYENIKGPTFSKWLRLASTKADDVIKCLFQIFMAVYMAYQRYDFTHYDLHSGNIIIHQLPEPRTITYPGNITIETDKLAIIIDYGLSHIQYDNVNVGKMDYQFASIFYDEGRPMYDFYRVMNSVVMIAEGRKDIMNAIRPLWHLMVKNEPEEYKKYKDVNWWPRQVDNQTILIDDFLNRMLGSYNIFSTSGSKELTYDNQVYNVPPKNYLSLIYNVLDQIINLNIPQLLRNTETLNQIEQALLDDISLLQYFDQIITIANETMKFREILYYTTLIETGEDIKQILMLASRRIAIVNAAIKDDYQKMMRLNNFNPDFFKELRTDDRDTLMFKRNLNSYIVSVLDPYLRQ